MPSIDDLMREIEQLRAENDMLKTLLKENGIALPTTVSNADSSMNEEALADTVITKCSPLQKKFRSSSLYSRGDLMYMPAAGRAKTDAPATVRHAKTNGSLACA